jgi:hypothetical protein
MRLRTVRADSLGAERIRTREPSRSQIRRQSDGQDGRFSVGAAQTIAMVVFLVRGCRGPLWTRASSSSRSIADNRTRCARGPANISDTRT